MCPLCIRIILLPTPIKSAACPSNNFSASSPVLTPPVSITGTLTACFAGLLRLCKPPWRCFSFYGIAYSDHPENKEVDTRVLKNASGSRNILYLTSAFHIVTGTKTECHNKIITNRLSTRGA